MLRKKTIVSNKSVVLVSASLLFLVAGLIYSPVSIRLVFAAPPHPCFSGAKDYSCICENNPAKLRATCCYFDTITGGTSCQTCEVNTDTGEFENCESKGRPGSSTIAPPPSGVAPPPSTETCPENTALDVNGNCTPVTQAPTSTDQGTTIQPPLPSDDNKPLKHKLSKGNILGELPQSGEELTAKKRNNNNDNSPTAPTCPTYNSPIPPNCTLKPKF